MVDYKQKLSIKDWPSADKPREKLLAKGRRHLTDAELLAILILVGNRLETAVDLSKRMLSHYENNLANLAKITVKELCKFHGIGEAKAVSIIAALELGRRRKETDSQLKTRIYSSKDVDAILRPELADLQHEEFWVLLLNRANYVISKQLISKGGQAGTVVDPKMIFKMALEQSAAGIILVHNHPSGSLTPSISDINITKKMAQSGALLELPILDHLIITDCSFISFADEGIM